MSNVPAMSADFAQVVERRKHRKRFRVYEQLVEKRRRLQLEWIQALGEVEEVETPLQTDEKKESQQVTRDLQEFMLMINLTLAQLQACDSVWYREQSQKMFVLLNVNDVSHADPDGHVWFTVDSQVSHQIILPDVTSSVSLIQYAPQKLGEMDATQTLQLYENAFDAANEVRFFHRSAW